MTVIQACEAYNNTLTALSLDGEWLTVRTMKSPEKIAAAAAQFGYVLVDCETSIEDGFKHHVITLKK